MDLFGKKAALENQKLKQEILELQTRLKSLGYDEYNQVMVAVAEKNNELLKTSEDIAQLNNIIVKHQQNISELNVEAEKLNKQIKSSINKLDKSRELYKSVEYAISNYFNVTVDFNNCKINNNLSDELNLLAPSVILKLHAMDMKDLKKAFRDNDKLIDKLLEQYSTRYTTKANKSIYQLMIIALRAELQNILNNLKYEKLDDAVKQVTTMTSKYLSIAGDGNQSIAGTLTKFIGEIEYLFINAVKIEYNYYVKKEQARQEQLAIREQMKQELADRKALEVEKKKIEAEEKKYISEIENVQAKIATASGDELVLLNKRILELNALLSDVVVKKDDILNLQNGKAGNIYIISNLGSFGDGMFKVGMTRRLNPQDRIDELGDASVPFRYDVHSFIFSEDAVSLEAKLHNELDKNRVNKVNLRKEFFYSSINELEELVTRIEPTAEFVKTMLAEEFRQSQSTDEAYTSSLSIDTVDDDE